MKILVTAGPTREPIDPVRFISNRSSGKMGYAVACAAAERGHEAVLISGKVCLPAPAGVETILVSTASELLESVSSRIAWCDALVMAAAVCDWRPNRIAPAKIKKRKRELTIRFEPVPDILLSVLPKKGSRLFVGFAAETGNLEEEARGKLERKGLDLIVANDVTEPGAGFDTDTNRVLLISGDGRAEQLPLMLKKDVAVRIIQWLEQKFSNKAPVRPSASRPSE